MHNCWSDEKEKNNFHLDYTVDNLMQMYNLINKNPWFQFVIVSNKDVKVKGIGVMLCSAISDIYYKYITFKNSPLECMNVLMLLMEKSKTNQISETLIYYLCQSGLLTSLNLTQWSNPLLNLHYHLKIIYCSRCVKVHSSIKYII